MKKGKKCLAFLLSFLMMLSMMPSAVMADVGDASTAPAISAESTVSETDDKDTPEIQNGESETQAAETEDGLPEESSSAEEPVEEQSSESLPESAENPEELQKDGSCLSAKSGATTTYTVTQGELLQVTLTDLFEDSSSHKLTYTLDDGDYGTQTKINQGILYFTNANAGTYTPTVTAKCSEGQKVAVKLTITVEAADEGDEKQYGYDETDASTVTVWVTVSNDGVPIVSSDGKTTLAHLKVEVPYFDLANQGLEQFYRYKTTGGSGDYTSDDIVRRPTALHLFLYLVGVYYLGYTPEEVTTGARQVLNASGSGAGVYNMDGNLAYDDEGKALAISGKSCSLCMDNFFGHDMNLMYYRNHVYPLMSAGWGATADYMLLSDNDTMDVAMFSNWSFWKSGSFASFDADEYSIDPEKILTFSTVKYDTTSVAQGGSEKTEPITGLNVTLYDENWKKLASLSPETADSNTYSHVFDKAGIYYLVGRDSKTGDEASIAPATAKVIVGGGFDPDSYYSAYDFSKITLDEAGTEYIYNITAGTTYVDHFMNPGDKTLYTVTIPEGTEYVYVTYPASFDKTILSYCALFDEDGNTDWSTTCGYSVISNADGSHTLKIQASKLIEANRCIAAEESNGYDYFNCFKFVYGSNTKPGGDTIAVTGVTLDKNELTLERRSSDTLTATVMPENADRKGVRWSSSDASVASVTTKGVVTALKEGNADITVTTADGSYTAVCHVTVTDSNKPKQAEDGYYEISTGAELKWFADEVNGSSSELNARLMADVDVSEYCSSSNPWSPIGDFTHGKTYMGTFDGQNHKVSGLYIGLSSSEKYYDTSSYYKALFGQCKNATIKNLKVYGTATSASRYVAGIVGRAWTDTVVENCHNYVTIDNSSLSGSNIYGYAGVVATSQDATIRNCSNEADILGLNGWVGGIVGEASATTIENCVNNGTVTAKGIDSYFNGVGGIAGGTAGTVNITNSYNTGAVSYKYRWSSMEPSTGGIVGACKDSGKQVLTMTNCYSTGKISETIKDNDSAGAIFGSTLKNASAAITAVNCYYLDTSADKSGVTEGAEAYTAINGLGASDLGDAYVDSCPSPVLSGMETTAHTDEDGDKICDVCGRDITAVPTRKSDYASRTTDYVQTGRAYLLSDLQAGKIFNAAEGESQLTYKNYYYERSDDGGKTWSEKQTFTEAAFGATTIMLTELKAGDYQYRFYASHDGKHFSKDTWTLTLHVEDNPALNFSFYVGKDYTGSYPVIKLYNVTKDEDGNEILGDELTDIFRYSDFSDEAPEGETAYDVDMGTLKNNYQMFYARLQSGRYAYRAFALNKETGAYDIELGGMTLDLPTDSNVDGNAGGNTSIYLRCVSFFTTTRKTDNTYFTADEYHVGLQCPIMGSEATFGKAYKSGNYAYYPTVLYAAGNACLYNSYAYPDIDGYIFSQSINNTFMVGYTHQTKSLTINTAISLTVTVPKEADFGLYFQWNNFNTTEVDADGEWKENEDGTKTVSYTISKGSGNYTWRMSDESHVTQAGWLSSMNASGEKTFTYSEGAATNRVSHDSSNLGRQTSTRDEADIQVNLDPSGYKTLTETTRVRAYRHWELINTDFSNIMLEPDFHWNVDFGDATVKTVNGGNASENWADITAGKQDSIVSVYYDSIDVNPGNYGTHGGLYPATQSQRVGYMVIGGTDVTHGTADAKVAYNKEEGATSSRSDDWDYNYDTWYWSSDETDPSLDFTVSSTGNTKVEYALAGAGDDMKNTISDFKDAVKGEDGGYSVPLKAFDTTGNGKGGTVIIRMTDDTGVSYRLVRVAKVTITATNVSHKGENIMPGDQVKLSFSGMFRSVNKVSGIFNPTTFKPTYNDDEDVYEGTLGQYQKMDNATITVTVPEDLEFAEGEETATYILSNGYTYGSMYSAANPFGTLYSMTDTGVGTNFNAVMVSYYINHYADAAITVYRKVNYDTALAIPDGDGKLLEGVTVTLTDTKGNVIAADDNGRYSLGYGTYLYALSKDGYNKVSGEFSLGSADAADVQDGVLTVVLKNMDAIADSDWDGTAKTEPEKDENGIYLIGTAEELAWFADAVNSGNTEISGKLTDDIDLASRQWTPIGSSAAKFTGTLDGDGHVVEHLYINSTENYQALIGYMGEYSTVKNLGVTGEVTTTGQFAAGIVGYMENRSVVESCYNAVNVTAAKSAAGLACGMSSYSDVKNCYNTGIIRSTSGSLAGGIASGRSTSFIPTVTNCYNVGTVYATATCGSLSPNTGSDVKNSYYLEDSCSSATSTAGTVRTSDELKAAASELGSAFGTDKQDINDGYPILFWQQTSLAFADVTLDREVYELGEEAVEPVVTVTLDGKELVRDVDYTVTLTGNDTTGEASVTITGIDGYKDSIEQTFDIMRFKYEAGNNRWETAAKVAEEAYPEGSSQVILVTGENFPDALAANALAGALDCPILLSKLDSLPDATKALLEKWGNPEVILIGGNWQCKDEINAVGTITREIAGKNRYETAEKIVEYGLENNLFDTDEVMVATGVASADALSMSSWSYAYRIPILLANKDGGFTEGTKELLAKFDMAYVAGADARVKTSALSNAGFALWRGNMIRLYGNNRYQTSYAISRYFLKTYQGATGNVDLTCYAMGLDANYPDALVGGVLAGKAGAPIILVSDSDKSSDTYELTRTLIKKGKPETVYLLGAVRFNGVDDQVKEAFGVK